MAGRNETLWISHSAIWDFEQCPKLYYLKNIYRGPNTGRRIQLANPYLSLGSAVHDVIEGLGHLAPEERFLSPITERFIKLWAGYGGKRGGFRGEEEEEAFKSRGQKMLERIERNQGVFKNPSYPFGESFPKLRLFPGKDVILVGNIDWVEMMSGEKLHIIDFKTGQKEEPKDSLQLPIYFMLASYNFEFPIEKLSYWYLEKDNGPEQVRLGPMEKYIPIVREKALAIKKAVDQNQFSCKSGQRTCFKCKDYDSVIWGRAEYVGYDPERNKDIYFIPR